MDAKVPLIREPRKVGKAHRKTPAQVAFACLRRNRHVVPIPGTKWPEQSEENAGAAGWSLGGGETRVLDRILRRLRLDTF